MNSFVALIQVISFVVLLTSSKRIGFFNKIFSILPIPFWCYLIPMILQTMGLLPDHRLVYTKLTNILFPIALTLLLLGIEIKAISRIGPKALIAMLTGALGIMLAGPILFLIFFRNYLPEEAWKGIGALTATWTGGSFNMIAIRSILDIPDRIFAPLIVVDAAIAYSWMAFLISMRNFEKRFSVFIKSSQTDTENYLETKPDSKNKPDTVSILKAVAIALALNFLCNAIAEGLPTGIFMASRSAWVVFLVSVFSISLSCIPSVRKTSQNGQELGQMLLYIVLSSLGAQANLSAIIQTPAWLLFGASLLLTHGLILIFVGRVFRIPLGILATASQSNIGGVISTPMVGAIYHSSLAPAGLIMAMVQNALGTYAGLAAAWIAKTLSAG